MARKKKAEKAEFDESITIWIDLAIDELKRALEKKNGVLQGKVFEDLEKWIGREKALLYWPSICFTATGGKDSE